MNYGNNDIVIAILSSYYNRKFEIPTFITLENSRFRFLFRNICKRYFSFGNNSYKDNTKLMAQATGQGAFPLTAIKKIPSNLELLELH
jgi:hypothetical protein